VKVPNARFIDTAFKSCKLLGIDWTTAGDTTVSRLFFSVRFNECILNYDVFFGMPLKRTKFIGCEIHEVDFREADLSEAVCTASDFAGSKFRDTNLAKADFRNATNYVIDPTVNVVKKARFSLPEAVSLLKGFDVRVE
jgi:uncharacterized protein YjbI with pentapeptide repeats